MMSGLVNRIFSYFKNEQKDLDMWDEPPTFIELNPTQKTLIRRVPAGTSGGEKFVVLRSAKEELHTTSRQHAAFSFDSKQKKWIIGDLKVLVVCTVDTYLVGRRVCNIDAMAPVQYWHHHI